MIRSALPALHLPEEALEEEFIAESADVLYHLLVMLESRNVTLDEVYAELQRRTGQSGLEEKAQRETLELPNSLE